MSALARRFPAILAAVLLAAGASAFASSAKAVRVLDWMIPVPAGWTPQVPSSPMRLAQFTAGSREGNADAAVFHFGLAGGGTVQENIDRWASQFLTDAGKPATPKVDKGEASGMPVTWVALDGRYARSVGSGTQGSGAANQSLRVAVLETPAGNLFFQLWGDRPAVARQEGVFRLMVQSLKRGP
jgi:hypothetical protein